jgi:hypothetical protein
VQSSQIFKRAISTIFVVRHPSGHPVSSTYSPHFPRWEDKRARARVRRRKISEVGHLLLSRWSIPRTTGTGHVERQKGKDEDPGVRVPEHLGELNVPERERKREREIENSERFDLSFTVRIIRERMFLYDTFTALIYPRSMLLLSFRRGLTWPQRSLRLSEIQNYYWKVAG